MPALGRPNVLIERNYVGVGQLLRIGLKEIFARRRAVKGNRRGGYGQLGRHAYTCGSSAALPPPRNDCEHSQGGRRPPTRFPVTHDRP